MHRWDVKTVVTKDYYRIMALTAAASEEEIKRTYRKLAMEYHPDRNRDDSNSAKNDMEGGPVGTRLRRRILNERRCLICLD